MTDHSSISNVKFKDLANYKVKTVTSFEDAMARDLWIYATFLLGFGQLFRDIPLVYNIYAWIMEQSGQLEDTFNFPNQFYKTVNARGEH